MITRQIILPQQSGNCCFILQCLCLSVINPFQSILSLPGPHVRLNVLPKRKVITMQPLLFFLPAHEVPGFFFKICAFTALSVGQPLLVNDIFSDDFQYLVIVKIRFCTTCDRLLLVISDRISVVCRSVSWCSLSLSRVAVSHFSSTSVISCFQCSIISQLKKIIVKIETKGLASGRIVTLMKFSILEKEESVSVQ